MSKSKEVIKMGYGIHTKETKNIERMIVRKIVIQKRIRTRWHDLDVEIRSLRYLLESKLEGRRYRCKTKELMG